MQRNTPVPCPVLLVVFVLACGEETQFPTGSAGDDTASASLPSCPGAWKEHEEGVWLQPSACLAWSPLADGEMDWYAAASPEDAVAGGCAQHCDDEPGYCAGLSVGGISSWRLPSLDELQAAGHAGPPMDDLEGLLWSRDSSDAAEDMAYQIELDTPEAVLMAGKSQEGLVRCVADL